MKLLKFLPVVCVALVAASAHADSFTFTASDTQADGPLSASAVVTTSAGKIQITLTNTLGANAIVSPGQALSDFSFTLSNPIGTVGTETASGQLGTVSGEKVTYTSGSPTRWFGTNFSASGSDVTLETIGGGKPSEMIAPSIANGGSYTNANGGFDNFTPYVIGPATFTIDLSGVTANTTISNVVFSFGTSPDYFVNGVPSDPSAATPEPSSLMLLGTGVLGAAGMLRRRIVRA